jgi:hypothetical protein
MKLSLSPIKKKWCKQWRRSGTKGKRCEDGDELITKIHGFLTPFTKKERGGQDRMNSVYHKN